MGFSLEVLPQKYYLLHILSTVSPDHAIFQKSYVPSNHELGKTQDDEQVTSNVLSLPLFEDLPSNFLIKSKSIAQIRIQPEISNQCQPPRSTARRGREPDVALQALKEHSSSRLVHQIIEQAPESPKQLNPIHEIQEIHESPLFESDNEAIAAQIPSRMDNLIQ